MITADTDTFWVELASKAVLLGRQLHYTTNISHLPALTFSRKKHLLHVGFGGEALIIVDGLDTLEVGATVYKSVGKRLGLVGLASPALSLAFDWNCDDRADSISVGVTTSGPPGERYVGRKDISMPVKTHTRARVESAFEPKDLRLMVACLAYFWNAFETDRVSS